MSNDGKATGESDRPAWPGWRQRRRLTGRFSAMGLQFVARSFDGGWHVVAYESGHAVQSTPSSGHNPDPNWHDELPAMLANIERRDDSGLYKYSESGVVTRQQLAGGGGSGIEVICKRGRSGGALQRLGSWWRGPKTWREFWLGHQVLRWGLTTPIPLACLWRSDGRLDPENWIMTRFVAEALPLDRTVRMTSQRGERSCRRSRLLDEVVDGVTELLAVLGRRCLYHRDLKPGNILVTSSPLESRVWLIDLDGLGSDNRAYGSGFRRSLVRLAVGLREQTDLPRTSYARGLRHLLGQAHVPGGRMEDWWRALSRAADRTLARRSGRG